VTHDPFRPPDPGAGGYDRPAGHQPGGYPPPGYGAPPPYGRAPRNGLGIAALVLGVLALLACWTVVGGLLFGLLAIVLGVIAWRRARRRLATNGGMAIAGVVLGVIGVVLSGLLLWVGIWLWNSDEVRTLRTCLDDAGSNQAAIDRCEREFQDQVENR
jgi:hypothetical protein